MEIKKFPSEMRTFNDQVSKTKITQLTNYKGHSHHLYFTNNGWYDDNSKLLFGSDRNNISNLYSVDLDTGEITQVTYFTDYEEKEFLSVSVNPNKDEAYYKAQRKIWAVDLKTMESRIIYNMTDGYMPSSISPTADGNFVCAGFFEDLSDKFKIDLLKGYVGFRETWAAMPFSYIVKIPVNNDPGEDNSSDESIVVWEEDYWVGHINTSPTQPKILTFCHEGPWVSVDQRIWGLDITTGDSWKIRPKEGNENFGHEYWYKDGLHIGYHGQTKNGKIIGTIKYDNSDYSEVEFPHDTGHTHSLDSNLIVGDAGKHLRLWWWNGEEYEGPYNLCEHRSFMNVQILHVHPQISPDGKQVLYTSDTSGYGNVYLADLPKEEEIQKLPFVLWY